MSQGLHHYMADLYPGSGISTEMETLMEPEEQMHMVDDQELAAKNPAAVTPETNKGVWLGVLAIVCIIAALGGRK
ncbi:hypothetical protein D3D03_16390 [Exiguobacterium sp. RIT452]|uniref:hypothetical protein n=1 Tax=Exiguobacterium sp. RIT452 TaxID=2315552 RepID=UPI000E760E53|nr:hypothetical protein [Exiguobacterium sp. RIT452]RJO94695.1 hypothetical protein D3D03_16390 [Exiguobacterium sp. RIT452]